METASRTLLERVDSKVRGVEAAAVAVPQLTRLLERVFFEAHVARRRIIDDHQLDEAALGLAKARAMTSSKNE